MTSASVFKTSAVAVALVSSLAAGSAAAQYTVKFGGAFIQPNATSNPIGGTLPAGGPANHGTSLTVKSKSTVLFTVERHFSDKVGVELVLGLPPEHDVRLNVPSPYSLAPSYSPYAGQVISTVEQVAPTVFVNYHFGDKGDSFRPFLGLGLNYTKFDAKLNSEGKAFYAGVGGSDMKLKLSDSFGPAVQAGVAYHFDEAWSLNVGVATSFISTKLTVTNKANGNAHTARFNFTPTVYTAAVGYSF